ncbi:PREDICTED: serine/threonine-protein phosphatase 4 regulatory subunit 1-like isoform X1 [Acropora digitifera]|uniref:serine/threonine-protein phosphatase 4 regulatory subunit 1-like isoform X1 n=1 Tax=Acropora digitifera TaxID=70779 RepID=UPI00077A7F14|nr:PREDICTED: serine/threonine-protein phosphatase 4 regulatory subunit 1-like isoform X1 [Acropora digitifera]
MADVHFHIEHADAPEEEEQEDESYEMDQEESSLQSYATSEELLSPIIRMERFMLSDIIVNRQRAARCCQDALRSSKTKEEVYHVLRLMVRLSDDVEPSVRVELMEQVPHVAVYCYEHHSMMEAVPQYILFIVLRFLTDSNNQVRKTSQAALLVLLEQEVVEREDIEEQVCPVLLQLTGGESNDDYRSEAVALMSKMAPLVGQDITERYFLPRFKALCSDPLFHVRKVCASNFGEMCSVLGPDVTSEQMLPAFFKLCQDGVWGVRKACAECYMSVSTTSPKVMRKNELSQFFISLLCDKSRWVQMAAYQSLGPFISTFADPTESGFYVSEEGILCAVPPRELETLSLPRQTEGEATANQSTTGDSTFENVSVLVGSSKETIHPSDRQSSPEAHTTDSGYISPPEITSHDTDIHVNPENGKDAKTLDQISSRDSRNNFKQHLTTDLDEVDDKYFDSFLYWRTPLPQVDLELEDFPCSEKDDSGDKGLELSAASLVNKAEVSGVSDIRDHSNLNLAFMSHHPKLAFMHGDDDSDEEDSIPLYSLTDDFHVRHVDHGTGRRFDYDDYRKLNLSHTSSFEEDLLIADQIVAPPVQDVIPQPLLDHYISMTEPAKAQTIDTEIVRHCAFSLPAVALTLGRKNWPCLRDTYELLSSDMQWKVRRTLAFSIHELALVLGCDITRIELVPIFNSFLKDLDEVRIGILKHLADFIKLLPSDIRMDYLPMLTDFLTTDNNRNWRFRFELAEQLVLLCELYAPKQVLQFICPIAISLATDRVADVRTIAFKLIGVLLQRLHTCSEDGPVHKFVCDIINKFAHSPQWTRRQAYAQLCQNLLEQNAETGEQFSQEFLPSLLFLLVDPVPNVRLSLARTLAQCILLSDYFRDLNSEGRDAINSAIQRLQDDSDRDVRYFAGVEEDALDVTFQDPPVSSESVHACSHKEDFGHLNEIPSGLSDAVHLKETVDDNVDTEELGRVEQLLLLGSEHAFSDENYTEVTIETSERNEFEENERRLLAEADALSVDASVPPVEEETNNRSENASKVDEDCVGARETENSNDF